MGSTSGMGNGLISRRQSVRVRPHLPNTMQWTYAKSIPKRVYVACSGGVDSVAVAAILSEWRDVTLLHFSHPDHAYEHELETVLKLSYDLDLALITNRSKESIPTKNREETWRKDRYRWFHSFDAPVITAHTLDDAVEWYLMTCLRGRGEFMPVENLNVLRPFLLTEKSCLIEYARNRNLTWWEDPTNQDPDFGLRSQVRNDLVPVAINCEPGLKRMVRRRLITKLNQETVDTI